MAKYAASSPALLGRNFAKPDMKGNCFSIACSISSGVDPAAAFWCSNFNAFKIRLTSNGLKRLADECVYTPSGMRPTPLQMGQGLALLPVELIVAPGPIPKMLEENQTVPHVLVSQITGISVDTDLSLKVNI